MENTSKSESFDSNFENNEDEGNTVTMMDVLEEQQKLEEDAYAVLGASDDKNCSYNQGYVKREALFSCKTCIDKDDKPACICLACSYHCHEGHDLIELYTKRNFRCDCGNSLFKGKKCSLEPNKEELNELNNYNQNFRGLYCTCARPYPDLEDSVQDEMLQCTICEDWFHSRHLGSSLPAANNFSEVICGSCTDRLGFLRYYSGQTVKKVVEETNDNSVDVESPVPNVSATVNEETSTPVPMPCTEKQNDENSKEPKKAKECLLKTLKPVEMTGKGATFWMESFRKSLCVCQSCQEMYKDLNVSYLTDVSDMVQAYEERGEKERSNTVGMSNNERTMQALSSLNRVAQIEAIKRYDELQTNLKEYLSKFVENKKVVREEDIHEFFQEMSRKKQKVEEVPYFCH
ncbi:hypothetical protein LSTR_LSTR012559 [Laodelphax striatellus]|uniref:UBR-type domain-containing protein n=1 Tax=Laodelphax striatellus TaxID=195883 RepID=A0A482XBR1_LAOST|nr:hypothetical protein LSTR_LSTR012559 [Laodelphax striatellus]